jgi:hypothetical protein
MSVMTDKFEAAVVELRAQGVQVVVHNPGTQTWYVKGEGIFVGYVVTGEELLELQRTNQLHLPGIIALS